MTVALWYGNRVPDDSKLTDEFIEEFWKNVRKDKTIYR